MKFIKFSLLLLTVHLVSVTSAQTIDRLPCVEKKFSVMIHLVKDSLGSTNVNIPVIRQMFDTLNKKFAPICIQFEICKIDSVDNWRYDSLYLNTMWSDMQIAYNAKNRINVYYVSDMEPPVVPIKGACGFAGGIGNISSLNSGGVVIKKLCSNSPKTLVHEFGHYFGLMHTFEIANGAELVNGSNCVTSGDGICDTPADPYILGDNPNNYVDASTCTFTSMLKDSNGQYYSPLVGNIMGYYQDNCYCSFTHDQYKKMAKYYLSNQGMW